MPKFQNAEEMVRWVLTHYELAPLKEGDWVLKELQRVERRGQLQDPDLTLLALTRKRDDPG